MNYIDIFMQFIAAFESYAQLGVDVKLQFVVDVVVGGAIEALFFDALLVAGLCVCVDDAGIRVVFALSVD